MEQLKIVVPLRVVYEKLKSNGYMRVYDSMNRKHFVHNMYQRHDAEGRLVQQIEWTPRYADFLDCIKIKGFDDRRYEQNLELFTDGSSKRVFKMNKGFDKEPKAEETYKIIEELTSDGFYSRQKYKGTRHYSGYTEQLPNRKFSQGWRGSIERFALKMSQFKSGREIPLVNRIGVFLFNQVRYK